MRRSLFGSLVLVVVAVVIASACSSSDKAPAAGNVYVGGGGSGGRDASADTGGSGGSAGDGGTAGGGGSGGSVTDASDEISCPVDHCSNHAGDCDESDNDCGGTECQACGNGGYCNTNSDCLSKRCAFVGTRAKCAPGACNDKIHNDLETDVDCGGNDSPPCARCGEGLGCKVNGDCTTGYCNTTTLKCSQPGCNDGAKNGDETGIDCGGPSCGKTCGIGQGCAAAGDCASIRCVASQCACPTDMVLGAGTTPFCIDAKEVTYAAYASFIASATVPTMPTECSYKAGNFLPSANWPTPAGANGKPVTNVDWCDAFAYCATMKRRLCGADGGAVAAADYATETKGEWYAACTGNGVNDYPYGNTYDPAKCNGGDAGLSATAAVPFGGASATCPGTLPNLFDMSGNVAEWENSCNAKTGSSDTCRVRGGGFASDSDGLLCRGNVPAARNASAADVGIRCCL